MLRSLGRCCLEKVDLVVAITHQSLPYEELGLDSQRVNNLAFELHFQYINCAARLVHTRRRNALHSTFQYY